jgi:hypothetical protein
MRRPRSHRGSSSCCHGCEVRHAVGRAQHGLVPRQPDARVPPVDPLVLVAFADGHVELPGSVGLRPAPQVVLVPGGHERCSVPEAELTVSGHGDLPPIQHRQQPAGVGPGDADVDVAVVSPGPAAVQLERVAAGDPPAQGRAGEQRRELRQGDRFPRPQLELRHAHKVRPGPRPERWSHRRGAPVTQPGCGRVSWRAWRWVGRGRGVGRSRWCRGGRSPPIVRPARRGSSRTRGAAGGGSGRAVPRSRCGSARHRLGGGGGGRRSAGAVADRTEIRSADRGRRWPGVVVASTARSHRWRRGCGPCRRRGQRPWPNHKATARPLPSSAANHHLAAPGRRDL